MHSTFALSLAFVEDRNGDFPQREKEEPRAKCPEHLVATLIAIGGNDPRTYDRKYQYRRR